MITSRAVAGSFAAVLLAGTTAALVAAPASAADDSALISDTSVVLASGTTGSPDALSAGPLAAVLSDGLLLTSPDHLSAPARAYIADNAPATVVIVGGATAVSSTVEEQVKAAAPGTTIRRVFGNDRYETAEKATELVDQIYLLQYPSSSDPAGPAAPAKVASTATR